MDKTDKVEKLIKMEAMDQMNDIFNFPKMENAEFYEHACGFIDRCLTRDNQAPTLLEQMNNMKPQASTSVSGLSDQDYPDLQFISFSLSTNSQIQLSAKVPLPPEVTEHFNHMQNHCMMGLFTTIKRAWITIDSDIYVWTYQDAGDVSYYDGLNETILCVGLIKPKHDIFHSFVKYLLVLATAVDIVVLGVTFNSPDDDCFTEIQLVPEPIFTIPTDGTIMTVIKGTNDGRIFMGSRDGCLYEIYYQAEISWFGKRYEKINHSTSKLSYLIPSFVYAALTEEDSIVDIKIDNSRHILYVLTEKSSIEVYDLGCEGQSTRKVFRIAQSYLVQQAHNAVKTLDSKNFYPIVSISAIELSDSARLNLMAITASGVRFYFTVITNSQVLIKDPRPTTLALVHVRMPPGLSATARHQPKAIHLMDSRDRNTVMISTSNEKDTIWNFSSDLFALSNVLIETYNTIDIDGPVFAMEEVPNNQLIQSTQQLPPLFARQHSEPARKVVILTAQGVYVMTKLRPVDLLMQLLLDSTKNNSGALKLFFSVLNEEQACATSLILASLQSPANEMFADLARSVFFKFGGKPNVATITNANANVHSPFGGFAPNIVSTPVASPNPVNKSVSFAGTPTVYKSTLAVHSPIPSMDVLYDTNNPVEYSFKHNGLYIYASRILRPIWNVRCVEILVLNEQNYITSSISSEECAIILNHLNGFCKFLQLNTLLSVSKNSPRNTEQRSQKDAETEERKSLESIRLFLNHISQVLGLWKILCEHQFQFLIEKVEYRYQDILKIWCFKDLFVNGQEICMVLLNVLINSYLLDNASVDFISSKLREVCPDLYKVEDAACSKANEILKTAKSVHNINEKEELLKSALILCKNLSPGINLQNICQQFISQESYFPVIDLVATSARKCDPEKKAEHYYYSQNENDQEGFQMYCKRMELYQKVLIMLETVNNQNLQSSLYVAQQNKSQNMNQSLPVINPVNGNADRLVQEIVLDVLRYPDELLHMVVYEWMLSKQMNGEIISIKHNSLEKFLIKASKTNPNNIKVLDVLWKYYENNNKHASAAEVLNNLACINSDLLSFKERINYLAHALMCLRNEKVGFSPCLGKFLSELEEKLEIARVQETILEAITDLKGRIQSAEPAEMILNTKLFDLTHLYEDFADKFNLWECKLAIVNCAGHTDYHLIENIWRNILQNELSQSTSVGNDALIHLLAKVKTLGKKYKNNDNCMPLEYLVPELEMISAKLKGEPSMVPKTLVTLGYPLEDLLNVYNKSMYLSAKHSFWLTQDNNFHYTKAISFLIRSFLNSQHKLTNIEKRKLISTCQDTIAELLSTSYSKPNTEILIKELRGLQTQLNKL